MTFEWKAREYFRIRQTPIISIKALVIVVQRGGVMLIEFNRTGVEPELLDPKK